MEPQMHTDKHRLFLSVFIGVHLWFFLSSASSFAAPQTPANHAEGVAALERGDVAAAKAAFARALTSNPKDAAAHAYLGIIADREGNLSEAEKHFAAAVAADAASPAAHNNYGTILLKRGRSNE